MELGIGTSYCQALSDDGQVFIWGKVGGLDPPRPAIGVSLDGQVFIWVKVGGLCSPKLVTSQVESVL